MTGFTPAYAMNPKNQGGETRTCITPDCDKHFTGYKIALTRHCHDCYAAKNCERCGPCAGTGSYVTGITNNVPTGPGGQCYRCGGKGYQTAKDIRRNDYYDRHNFNAR